MDMKARGEQNITEETTGNFTATVTVNQTDFRTFYRWIVFIRQWSTQEYKRAFCSFVELQTSVLFIRWTIQTKCKPSQNHFYIAAALICLPLKDDQPENHLKPSTEAIYILQRASLTLTGACQTIDLIGCWKLLSIRSSYAVESEQHNIWITGCFVSLKNRQNFSKQMCF